MLYFLLDSFITPLKSSYCWWHDVGSYEFGSEWEKLAQKNGEQKKLSNLGIIKNCLASTLIA